MTVGLIGDLFGLVLFLLLLVFALLVVAEGGWPL